MAAFSISSSQPFSKISTEGSLSNAIGAFTWENDEKNINLIVMNAGNYDDIDISQAVFGTEMISFPHNGSFTFKRDSDGFFNDPSHSSKICGVIALRKTEHVLISSHKKTLFINQRFIQFVDLIKGVVEIDEILTFKNLPKSD